MNNEEIAELKESRDEYKAACLYLEEKVLELEKVISTSMRLARPLPKNMSNEYVEKLNTSHTIYMAVSHDQAEKALLLGNSLDKLQVKYNDLSDYIIDTTNSK